MINTTVDFTNEPHLAIKIPEQELQLLKAIASHTKGLEQKQFNMALYITDDGAIGCVLGRYYYDIIHDKRRTIYWVYVQRWAKLNVNNCQNEGAWAWLFSNAWSKVDNTPLGAYLRIMYFIEYGLPVNWKDQMFGDAPISYINFNPTTA